MLAQVTGSTPKTGGLFYDESYSRVEYPSVNYWVSQGKADPGCMGGGAGTEVTNSFNQSQEKTEFSYNFFATEKNSEAPPEGRWTQGVSLDGKGVYTVYQNQPLGDVPNLGPAHPNSGAEKQQIG